jgi:hypothetical protein
VRASVGPDEVFGNPTPGLLPVYGPLPGIEEGANSPESHIEWLSSEHNADRDFQLGSARRVGPTSS